jgi:hypothetical protein
MAMRQYVYRSSVPEAHRLMQLLYEFDELVREWKPEFAPHRRRNHQ